MILLVEPIPYDGFVTQWYYISTLPTSPIAFKAVIWHKSTADWWCEVVGVNEIPSAPAYTNVTYTVPVEERIHAKKGDYIGFVLRSPGLVVYLPDEYRHPDKKLIRLWGTKWSQIKKGYRNQINAARYMSFSLQATIESSE